MAPLGVEREHDERQQQPEQTEEIEDEGEVLGSMQLARAEQ